MKKKIVIALAVMLGMSTLVGCGNLSKGNSSKSDDVFVIAGSGPLTGDAASYGIAEKNAAELAVKEINEAGGINGQEVVLKFEDDEANPEKAKSAYNKLIDEGADVILGNVTSGATIAIADLTLEDKLLMLTPSASAMEAVKHPNAFRICFTDPYQGSALADYIFNDKGIQKIAIIYNNGDAYSKGINDAFVENFEALGGEVVASEAFQTGDTDFTAQLSKIASTDAQGLVLPNYYQDVATIVQQAKQKGVNLPLFGSDGWDGVIPQLGGDTSSVEGAIFLTPFTPNSDDAKTKEFVKKYMEAYKDEPSQFAADAYDGVYVIKAAVEKAGSTDLEALQKAMTEIEIEGITGKMKFSADGEVDKSAKFIEIKGGEYSIIK